MSDHVTYTTNDLEMEYLVEVFDDGAATLATRPRFSMGRWSPPIVLDRQPAEACS